MNLKLVPYFPCYYKYDIIILNLLKYTCAKIHKTYRFDKVIRKNNQVQFLSHMVYFV